MKHYINQKRFAVFLVELCQLDCIYVVDGGTFNVNKHRILSNRATQSNHQQLLAQLALAWSDHSTPTPTV